ncbi:MAG: hypothetical protein FJ109_02170 [Deltaproteobacteria bacterium]|nr:hypothetical protein [Deltaproteobacteria bacterium]
MFSRPQRWTVTFAVVCLAALGCSNGTTVKYEDAVDSSGSDGVADIPLVEDRFELLDFVTAEVEYIPQPGEFLWPCTDNSECDSGFCVTTKDGGRCTTQCVEDCPKGWACVEADTKPDIIYVCMPKFLTLCDPCRINDDCKTQGVTTTSLDLCLEFPNGLGSFCGADCSTDAAACPAGYQCETVTTPGGTFQQCMPTAGECTCSFPAVQAQKSTDCFNANESGKCTGERMCEASGLSECSALIPSAEKCDDVDNDCDLAVDEGCNDDGDGFCDATMTTPGKPVICGSGGGDCDDTDGTVYPGATELCDKKDNNCDGTKDEGLCEDGNPCTDDLCDPIEGCSHPNNAKLCDDGNSCTDNDHCYEGKCEGGPKVCEDNNPCTDNLCDPVSEKGCKFVNNSNKCDDDGNPCTIDVCENGTCQHKLASALPCDDGNPCTEPDMCNSGMCVSGAPKNCDDKEECTKDSCTKEQGCVHDVLNGTPCTYDVFDLGICKLAGTCGSNGCVPKPNCNCPNCFLCVCCTGLQLCLDNLLPGS